MKTVLFIFSLCIFNVLTKNQHSDTKQIISEMSWGLKTYYFDNIAKLEPPSRRVGVQYLRSHRRQYSPNPDDDVKMKTKIFRLMYEMIRDAEMKMKKAEDISKIKDDATGLGYYVKIGYMCANAKDKQSVLNNIAATLKKRYSEWEAIEHVNAYEQALTIAIEIDNIVIAHNEHLKQVSQVFNVV